MCSTLTAGNHQYFSHRIHVWYILYILYIIYMLYIYYIYYIYYIIDIYLHLVDLYGKCRQYIPYMDPMGVCYGIFRVSL